MPDRRVDTDARKRLDRIEAQYMRFATSVYVILGAMVAVLVALTIFTVVTRGDFSQANEERSVEAAALAERADDLARQIQAERAVSIRNDCEAQNRENASAKRELRRIGFDPLQERVIIRLLDALAPVQDCQARVDRRVNRDDGG